MPDRAVIPVYHCPPPVQHIGSRPSSSFPFNKLAPVHWCDSRLTTVACSSADAVVTVILQSAGQSTLDIFWPEQVVVFLVCSGFPSACPHRSLRVRPMLVRTKCDTIHFLATRLPYTRPFLLSFRPDSWLTAHLTINSSLSPSQKILSFPKTPSSPIFFTFALSKSSKPPIPPFPIPMPSITRQGLVYHSQRLQIPI
jgi:hypothetical protein